MLFRSHILIPLLICVLIFTAWYRILSQTFQGEGYYYFFQGYKDNGNIFRYDIGAGLLFDLLAPIFKDNFFLYQGFALLSFVLIGILFYFFVNVFTKNKKVSLIAAILFGFNFSTSFEMLAGGSYQNFLQRIFFFIPVLISFILFFKFLEVKKWYYYIFSLILSSAAVFFAYFSIFYIAFLSAFLLGFVILKRFNLKKIIKEVFFILTFIILNIVIVYLPVLVEVSSNFGLGEKNLFEYIFHNVSDIVFHNLRQLTILTIPDVVIKVIFEVSNISYGRGLSYLFLPVVLLYVFVVRHIYKNEKKLRLPIISALLFLPISFTLNMFIRADNVHHLEAGSRYLFASSIGFSIFWAIFTVHILRRKPKVLIYSLIIFWFVLQSYSINREINKEDYKHIATKNIVSYIKKQVSPKLYEDSIVIVPNLMSVWGASFCELFYGKSKTLFLLLYDQIKWKEDYGRPFDPKRDFILNYDYEKSMVVDITKDYKEILINYDIPILSQQ
ncbi:MAG: hypothetical protein HYT07_02385 [Candidatus Levybacteria bacterium]|nr:hypothetical protein [Candidatus Levybacteria bacterium]